MADNPIQPPPPREGLTSEGFVTRVWYRWLQLMARTAIQGTDVEKIVAAEVYRAEASALNKRIQALEAYMKGLEVPRKSYDSRIAALESYIKATTPEPRTWVNEIDTLRKEVVSEFYRPSKIPTLLRPYGEIYYHGAGANLAMAAQDFWYQFVGFDTVGSSNLMTVSIANSDITPLKDDIYIISLSLSVRCANAEDFDIGMFKNNGTVPLTCADVHVTTVAGGKDLSASVTCFASLSGNDTLEVWAQRTSGGVALRTLIFGHCIINVRMIGKVSL